MAYMPSSAPLPQNSLMPPPQGQVNASNARLMRDFMASRTGRERVYSTIPTAASFFKEVSPALAVDAAQMLGQSESARQSVLIGLGLPSNLQDPSLDQIVAAAPANVSLNAPSTTGGLDQTQSGSMPAAAPVQVIPGLWSSQVIPGLWSSPNQNGNGKGQRGVTGIGSRLQIGGRPSKSENQSQFDSGPGCAPPLALPPQPLPAMPSPPAAPDPPSPASTTTARPPTYVNICWARRANAVLQSQIDPSVDRQCSQLGYYVGCEQTPPNAMAYISQMGSNLPKISVNPSDLAAIPPAPAGLESMSCAQAWQLGGLSGVALDWGDAGVQQTQTGNGSTGAELALLGLLAVGAAVLVIWDKRKGRR